MSYADHVDAERRLMILQLLIEAGGKLGDGSLLTSLRQMGQTLYLDTEAVRRLMRELSDKGCVTVTTVRDVMLVAEILERGRMAAAGHVSIDGIASPHRGL